MVVLLAWLVVFHHIFLYVAEGIAVFSNTILVYLIVTERKKLYSDYRRDLLMACVVDYICSFIGIVLQPHFEILDGQWIAILKRPLTYLPKFWQIVALGFYSLSNCFGMTTIPIHFLFRKLLICNNKQLSSMQIFYLTSVCFVSSLITVYMFSDSFFVSEGYPLPKQELIDAGIIKSDNVLLNAKMTTIPMISLIVTISIMTCGIFASVTYLSFKTYKNLNAMYDKMSPQTRQMQANFNRMLGTQICASFLFGVIPAMFLIFLMITKMNIVGAGMVISILFACVPVINPLCTLFLVKQFRKRFLSFAIEPSSTADSSDQPQQQTQSVNKWWKALLETCKTNRSLDTPNTQSVQP